MEVRDWLLETVPKRLVFTVCFFYFIGIFLEF